MNPRLREFEKLSGLEIYGLGARREKWEHCMEKFTELIVKECIEAYNNDGYQTEYEQDQKVLKHFGVEE